MYHLLKLKQNLLEAETMTKFLNALVRRIVRKSVIVVVSMVKISRFKEKSKEIVSWIMN